MGARDEVPGGRGVENRDGMGSISVILHFITLTAKLGWTVWSIAWRFDELWTVVVLHSWSLTRSKKMETGYVALLCAALDEWIVGLAHLQALTKNNIEKEYIYPLIIH